MAFVSCEKNYLDVNKDPNHPHVLVPKQILLAAIGHTAYVMGNGNRLSVVIGLSTDRGSNKSIQRV